MLLHRRNAAAIGFWLSVIALNSAQGQVTFDIKCTDVIFGTVTIDRTTNQGGNEGLLGQFATSTKLSDFEKCMGQEHLNWFQKVTSITPGPPGPRFVDPPSGGLGPIWNDDRPWYWDETRPIGPLPAGKTFFEALQLNANIVTDSTELLFEDYPHGQNVGTVISFATFLISDFGNHTYRVLGSGFSWDATIMANGRTSVTGLQGGAAFTDEYEREIRNEYPGNYSRVVQAITTTALPEITSFQALSLGIVALVVFSRLAGGRRDDLLRQG